MCVLRGSVRADAEAGGWFLVLIFVLFLRGTNSLNCFAEVSLNACQCIFSLEPARWLSNRVGIPSRNSGSSRQRGDDRIRSDDDWRLHDAWTISTTIREHGSYSGVDVFWHLGRRRARFTIARSDDGHRGTSPRLGARSGRSNTLTTLSRNVQGRDVESVFDRRDESCSPCCTSPFWSFGRLGVVNFQPSNSVSE